MAESRALGSALNDAGNIRQHERRAFLNIHHAEVRKQRVKG
jgi:hypothetical protein